MLIGVGRRAPPPRPGNLRRPLPLPGAGGGALGAGRHVTGGGASPLQGRGAQRPPRRRRLLPSRRNLLGQVLGLGCKAGTEEAAILGCLPGASAGPGGTPPSCRLHTCHICPTAHPPLPFAGGVEGEVWGERGSTHFEKAPGGMLPATSSEIH